MRTREHDFDLENDFCRYCGVHKTRGALSCIWRREDAMPAAPRPRPRPQTLESAPEMIWQEVKMLREEGEKAFNARPGHL